jgi:hypothetical protein
MFFKKIVKKIKTFTSKSYCNQMIMVIIKKWIMKNKIKRSQIPKKINQNNPKIYGNMNSNHSICGLCKKYIII